MGSSEERNPTFEMRRNWLPGALKIRLKSLFIQQLAAQDFALGAVRLSWHK
jgi:hypothetical protein